MTYLTSKLDEAFLFPQIEVQTSNELRLRLNTRDGVEIFLEMRLSDWKIPDLNFEERSINIPWVQYSSRINVKIATHS